MSRNGSRGLFCLAVAVCAAAVIDPFVEAASNAGWFGRGTFTDHSTLDVIPAVAASAVLALLYIVLRAGPAAGPRSLGLWLRDSLPNGASKPTLPLLAAIFAAQLAVLYAMETAEQILVAGHPLGGTIWLGAPIAIALAVHAGVGALIAYLLAHTLDALTRITIRLAIFVYAIFLRDSHATSLVSEPMRERVSTERRNPLASRSGKRAPPLLFA